MFGLLGHLFGMFFASPDAELPNVRPLMNSAMTRFWPSLSACACICMEPVVIDA
jgi:hypothetical protein